MEKEDNIHLFVDKNNVFYNITLIIDKIDQRFSDGVLTFVASNECGFDEAVVLINIISGYFFAFNTAFY